MSTVGTVAWALLNKDTTSSFFLIDLSGICGLESTTLKRRFIFTQACSQNGAQSANQSSPGRAPTPKELFLSSAHTVHAKCFTGVANIACNTQRLSSTKLTSRDKSLQQSPSPSQPRPVDRRSL